jgi:hypothetical protein
MKFQKFMLMNEAGDLNGGGGAPGNADGSNQTTNQPNELDTLKSQLEALRGDFDAVKKNRDEILTEKKKLELVQKERASKSLEEQGDFKTLWENEKTRAVELDKTLNSIKEEEQSSREKLILDAKTEEAFKALGGRDKFHNPEDIKRGLVEKIVINPETGKFDEAGLKQFADDFRSRLGYTLKSSVDDIPRDAGNPMAKAGGEKSKEELKKMTFNERLAYATTQSEKGKK